MRVLLPPLAGAAVMVALVAVAGLIAWPHMAGATDRDAYAVAALVVALIAFPAGVGVWDLLDTDES